MTRKEQEALLALFNSYRPSKRVTTLGQLSDGKVLMEVSSCYEKGPCLGSNRLTITGHALNVGLPRCHADDSDETHFKGAPKTPNKRLSTGAGGQDDWVLRMNTL